MRACANARTRAIALVNGAHYAEDRPEDFKKTDKEWRKDGWAVPVDYHPVDVPLKISDHMAQIGRHLPAKHLPLKPYGAANQAYLLTVPEGMAAELLSLLYVDDDDLDDWQDEVPIKAIRASKKIGETEKAQLINDRLGQGIYRKNVGDIEKACRVTGTSEPNFLIASHTRPWANSTNNERLDGNSSLMLAPHIDQLFDREYISIEDDGILILSTCLPEAVRLKWGVAQKTWSTPLSTAQVQYMRCNREVLLRK